MNVLEQIKSRTVFIGENRSMELAGALDVGREDFNESGCG